MTLESTARTRDKLTVKLPAGYRIGGREVWMFASTAASMIHTAHPRGFRRGPPLR